MDEEKKALAQVGFELGTSSLRDHHADHFATTTALRMATKLDVQK